MNITVIDEVGQPECGSKRLKGNRWVGGRWGGIPGTETTRLWGREGMNDRGAE